MPDVEQPVVGSDEPTNASGDPSIPFVPRGGRSVAEAEIWMRAIRPRLTALARRFLWNAHDAEEVAQDALLLAWKNADQLLDVGARNAWVYRTTINLCISRLRRKRGQPLLSEDVPGPDMDPAESGTVSELAARVRTAISELPELLRVALVLRDLEGLDYKQMALVAQSRPGTLRLRVHRAREMVRQTLLRRWPDSFGTQR